MGGSAGEPGQEDLKLSGIISSYWVNFARSGYPNRPNFPEWPAFTDNDPKVMVFDAGPGTRPLPNMEILKAIDAYYTWLRGESE